MPQLRCAVCAAFTLAVMPLIGQTRRIVSAPSDQKMADAPKRIRATPAQTPLCPVIGKAGQAEWNEAVKKTMFKRKLSEISSGVAYVTENGACTKIEGIVGGERVCGVLLSSYLLRVRATLSTGGWGCQGPVLSPVQKAKQPNPPPRSDQALFF